MASWKPTVHRAQSCLYRLCNRCVDDLDWGWTWQNITVTGSFTAFDTTSYGGDGGQGTGSLTIIDSTFVDCQIGVSIHEPSALDLALTSLISNGLVIQNTSLIVATPNGTTFLAGSHPTSVGVVFWVWSVVRGPFWFRLTGGWWENLCHR